MRPVSICITLRNRADLFKYCLEGIARQEYDLSRIEICIGDSRSTDNLITLLDRYSDLFTFRYAWTDKTKSYLPKVSNCPAPYLNSIIKYMPTNDIVIKMDPEIVMRDSWLLQEIVEGVTTNPLRMYNARCHFTEGDGWYSTFEDIINNYERHYHYAEGGPFSRSRYYFCSGFSRDKFLEIRGIDEMFVTGCGYDDDNLRTTWKNRFGAYEYEISAEGIHLWHGPNRSRPALEYANRRLFENLKNYDTNNVIRLKDNRLVRDDDTRWANPEMLSKIYTIKDSKIINVEDVNDGNSLELNLPF